MNAKEIKKHLELEGAYSYGVIKGIPYQISKSNNGNKDEYIITLFSKPKPQFKIGDKTFIVS